MVRALSYRIVLSLLLFIILLVAFSQGWIAPHPIEGYKSSKPIVITKQDAPVLVACILPTMVPKILCP